MNPSWEAFVSGGKTFIHVSCKYVLDLIFADIRNADDSDTEVVINQYDQGSRRCFTKRDELGQGDIYIYIVKKWGSGTIYVEIAWGLWTFDTFNVYEQL